MPPFNKVLDPSSFSFDLNELAILKAILVAREVLPIEGLPAIISKSEECSPPSFLSKSMRPVEIPDIPPCF